MASRLCLALLICLASPAWGEATVEVGVTYWRTWTAVEPNGASLEGSVKWFYLRSRVWRELRLPTYHLKVVPVLESTLWFEGPKDLAVFPPYNRDAAFRISGGVEVQVHPRVSLFAWHDSFHITANRTGFVAFPVVSSYTEFGVRWRLP